MGFNGSVFSFFVYTLDNLKCMNFSIFYMQFKNSL